MKIACLAPYAALRGALLFTVLSPFAASQNQAWLRQFGTNGSEYAHAAAPDGVGGVYVSGSTSGNLGGPHLGSYDAWLARYDAVGNQTWIRQFGTSDYDDALAAATDDAGGVYVGGMTGSLGADDAWLARYDDDGNETWMRSFGTSTTDILFAAAPDGAGGVFVGGYTAGSLGGPSTGWLDAWLAHYDGAGHQTWIRQFGAGTGNSGLFAAAADGAGGVYVSGYTRGSLGGPHAGQDDAWIAHYDGSGNQTWLRQFGTIEPDIAYAAAPDGSGGVFVSGYTLGDLGGPNAGMGDAWLARYDSAGNQTWLQQFGTSGHDFAYAVATGPADGVYVGVSTTGDLGGQNVGGWDAWLATYDGAGTQTGIRQFGTAVDDRLAAAAPDGVGGVYLCGATEGDLGGPHAGGATDAWLVHYDGLEATRYCTPALPNSTGRPGVLAAIGSNAVLDNNVTLLASQLPPQAFGVFLTSMTEGVMTIPGGSQGNLCLGGSIGTFAGPGQVLDSGASGSFSLAIDLSAMPLPTGMVAVQPGDTWYFQSWHRDANPTRTTNFTDAVAVQFE